MTTSSISIRRLFAPCVFATLPSAAIGGVQFFPPTTFELSGSEPRRIATGDLDGDGNLDLVVSMSAEGEVAFRFGDGSGALPDDGSLQTGVNSWGLDLADFDGDGDLDLVTGDGVNAGTDVRIFANDGEGSFSLVQTLTAGSFPIAMVAEDLDSDGHPDLAVASNVSHALSIFLNDGTGSLTFQGFVASVDTAHGTDLAGADIDADGDIDLALAHYDGVHILTNDGSGVFQHAGTAGHAPGTTHAVDLGDVDEDGVIDVVSAHIYSGTAIVRRGNGDGTFGAPILLDAGTSAIDVMLEDLTGEGRDDVIVVNQSISDIVVFEALGLGSFAPSVAFDAGNQASTAAAADFDNDGELDLAVPDRNLGETPELTVLINDQVPSLCIDVLEHPFTTAAWSGHIAVVRVDVVGQPPLTFTWSKDGAAIADGTTPSGSTIEGSGTDTLIIRQAVPGDSGAYSVVITSACGSEFGYPVDLVVAPPATLPPSWQATLLHPGAETSSSAQAVDAFGQYGSTKRLNTDLNLYVDHPASWNGSAGTHTDLTPAGSAGGTVLNSVDGLQVGWWWWPYGCQHAGTCYSRQGASWLGTSGTHDNHQVSGWEYSTVSDTNGIVHVGTKSDDDEVGNTFAHAVIWSPPNYWSTDLHPAGASKSYGLAIDGDRQFGYYLTPYPGPIQKACMWEGSAGSMVEMNPPGASSSYITSAGDGQQAGTARFGGVSRAGLWAGTADSFMEFALGASLTDCAQGLQVGSIDGGAAVWATSPEPAVELHQYLPASYGSSYANAIYIHADGAIDIVGTAYNTDLERNEAVLWRSVIPSCPGDANGDGEVDFDDLNIVLQNFGSTVAPGTQGDVNATGTVDFDDLNLVLANWQAC